MAPGHPVAEQEDPFRGAKNGLGGDCCGGQDCEIDEQMDPKPAVDYSTKKDGVKGVIIDGLFFSNEHQIKPMSLPVHLRNKPIKCISRYLGTGNNVLSKTPMCWYYPKST